MNYTNKDYLKKLIELQIKTRKNLELKKLSGDIIV